MLICYTKLDIHNQNEYRVYWDRNLSQIPLKGLWLHNISYITSYPQPRINADFVLRSVVVITFIL